MPAKINTFTVRATRQMAFSLLFPAKFSVKSIGKYRSSNLQITRESRVQFWVTSKSAGQRSCFCSRASDPTASKFCRRLPLFCIWATSNSLVRFWMEFRTFATSCANYWKASKSCTKISRRSSSVLETWTRSRSKLLNPKKRSFRIKWTK